MSDFNINETAPALSAQSFPLQGTRLIEASAGTGKTYTLAALYVRLVLGHGAVGTGPANGAALLPPKILVVTFTKAATEELRDRIRQRLVDAAQVFRGQSEPDEVLASIVSDYAESDYAKCAAQLQLAAEWMDEAAIFTIHGWCQRMLSEHAFDAGTAFAQTMNKDLRELSLQIARDYWRYFLYSLPDNRVLHHFGDITKSPEALYQAIRPWLGAESDSLEFRASGAALPPALEPIKAAEQLQGWFQKVDQHAAKLREFMQPEALAELDEAFAKSIINKNKFREKGWLENERPQLENWIKHPERFDALDSGSQKFIEKYSADNLMAGTKAKFSPPSHPLFAGFSDLVALFAARPQLHLAVLHHAACWFTEEFQKRKQQRAELGFDDLLTRLYEALHREGGEALAERIRVQFPMAMVDEFQDTDAVQFGIFRKIYPKVTSTDYGLVLVGDPKQAIYSFRGADLYTYLNARELTAGQHYNLPKNYRSTHNLVASVNALFVRAEKQDAGAFGFAHEGHNPLPFFAVAAAGKQGFLQEHGANTPALNYWLADEAVEELRKGEYQQRMANACADRIAELLNGSALGTSGFSKSENDELITITPADIAILVRDRNEAKVIRDALNARALRSVYMSDKDSIFATEEATTMLSWLQAVYSPENETRLRAALLLRLSGQSDSTLSHWFEDEQAWEKITDQVREFRDIWRYQGVLPMIRAWLHAFDLPQRWLQNDSGERTLTNMLHLAELLQQESSQRDGETGLMRWFAQQLDAANPNEELVQRLESDADRIKVVTIHKSKGLQYNLVFLPFICGHKAVTAKHSVRYHAVNEDSGHTIVELEPDDEAIARADNERLQEDIRLLYVALTRPVYACWLGLGAYRDGNAKYSAVNRSGLGWLLNLPAKPTAADLKTALAELPWQHEQEPSFATYENAPSEAQPQSALRLPRAIHTEHWWIASYSALRTGAIYVPEAPDTATQEHYQDDDQGFAEQAGNEPTIAYAPENLLGMHGFPRGASAGTFLHNILEVAAEHKFKQTEGPEMQALLSRRLTQRGWEAETETLQSWLQQLTSVPLATGDECLTELPAIVAEMEFWLEVNNLKAADLDRVISRYLWPGKARPALLDEDLNGMLKGFIDLTYQDNSGRYWVCDYKSNWLGNDSAAYTERAMEKAMLEKRYDVQASLYLFALHRLLSARIPDYVDNIDHYLGGGMYWFIREPAAGQCVLKPDSQLLHELDALFRAEAAE
ncbi:exodeoxyribonuclease V, beta subunit [Idiomarina sp. A28L]|uniref:exodeoxyribonuclease V subunit beta n=1 Tax=Idiomarina sp. A28L TaxID=1036674 RepID=UPI0002138C25|nr:exodeoxyribonuclease V subunit beta [Idiomarina sp. A28L]EGN75423.1 exodeoxyribonuclease V, beta subunit [Idiomarina sp. A28L]